jgi:hypothetical protein
VRHRAAAAPICGPASTPFENAIQDKTRKLEVREREFAVLDVKTATSPAVPAADDPKVKKLETGFWSISGATVGADGALYFIEKRFQRIYRWTAAKGLEIVRDSSLDPTNLAVDRSGNLLVVSSYGPQAASTRSIRTVPRTR